MRYSFIRRRWPKVAFITMISIYSLGQLIQFFVSYSSGWWDAKKLYQTKIDDLEGFHHLNGELKMGKIRFGREAVAVYKSGDAVLIKGPKMNLALGFLYLPDLRIPSEKFESIQGESGSLVNCGAHGKVYFKVME